MLEFRLDRFNEPLDEVSAGDAAYALGALAPFWLTDEARRLLAEAPDIGGDYWLYQPSLPAFKGGCWVMVVNKANASHAILRSAMLLPLVWRKGVEHDERLPQDVRRIADQVLASVQSIFDFEKLTSSSWGLALYHRPGEPVPNLREVTARQLDASSGWAAIAAGLIIAGLGGEPNVRVWATGCWAEPGIARVESLHEKIDLALSSGVSHLFVPEVQVEFARKYLAQRSGEHLQINVLRKETTNIREALGEYLTANLVRPSTNAERDVKRIYHRTLYQINPGAAEDYYQTDLVPQIVEECRKQARWARQRPTHLVTIASGSAEAVLLAIEIVNPLQCLVLHTDNRQGHDMAAKVHELLASRKASPTIIDFPFTYGNEMIEQIRSRLLEFSEKVSPELVVYDMTPGKFLIKLTLLDNAHPQSPLIHLDHRFYEDIRLVEPFSQQLVAWKKGEQWQFPDPPTPDAVP